MRAVLQRVKGASVAVDGTLRGECGTGWLILLGVETDDTAADAGTLAGKIARLRAFEDENGRMNRSATDIGGGALVVPNFTLCADCSHGNRPDFFGAAPPDEAKTLFLRFCDDLASAGVPVGRGVFGADMRISASCDGPVTIILSCRGGRVGNA